MPCGYVFCLVSDFGALELSGVCGYGAFCVPERGS